MPRRRHFGNVLSCLHMADHHIKPGSVTVDTVRTELNPEQEIDYRNNLIIEEIAIAIAQLEVITQIARENDYKDILEVLGQQFEHGHDFSQSDLTEQKSSQWSQYKMYPVGKPFNDNIPAEPLPSRNFPVISLDDGSDSS
jgi:hypothetical protein